MLKAFANPGPALSAAYRWISAKCAGRAVPALLFLFGFLLASLYWPDIMGPATSPRWALLAVTVPASLFASRIHVSLAHVLGAVFGSWAIGIGYFGTLPLDAVNSSWKLLIIAAAFCAGSMRDDLRPILIGSAVGLGISLVIVALEATGIYRLPNVTVTGAGLFVNSILFGEACALVAVGLFAHRLFWFMPLPLSGLAVSEARGAILACGIGIAATFIRRPRYMLLALALAAFAAIAAQGLAFGSLEQRAELWQAMLPKITWIGAGLGSYYQAAPHPIAVYSEHAHNEFAELAFETGWIGLALFMAFCLSIIASGVAAIGAVFIALIVEACFAFPFHEPFTAAMGMLCAGCACRRLRGARSALADCGSYLRGRLGNRRPASFAHLSQRVG